MNLDEGTPSGYHTIMKPHDDPSTASADMPMVAMTPLSDGDQHAHRSTSYAHDKVKILARLRRIEGQVRGVQRMVEEDQYCLDVLTQLSAIIAAARQTGLLVLEDHVRGCVVGDRQDGQDGEALLAELIGAIDRFGRSVG